MNSEHIFRTNVRFPSPESADKDGLLAVGGNLSPGTLLLAYSSGIFPWSVDPITWWSPNPRTIFDLGGLYVSHRLRRIIDGNKFTISFNKSFRDVMEGCAHPSPKRRDTWISAEFIEAYTRLHELGYAQSVEAWLGNKLAGGVYGVSIGGFFAGESMFHTESNASNVALFHLFCRLREKGFILFDSQVPTPHTRRTGAYEIPRKEYIRRLSEAISLNRSF